LFFYITKEWDSKAGSDVPKRSVGTAEARPERLVSEVA